MASTTRALLLVTLSVCAIGSANKTPYKEHVFRTKVDHFAYHNDETFEMRYMVADQYWDRNGGPIFLYTGNEDDIESFITNTSPSKLGYLTSEQALADYADLLLHLKAKLPGAEKSPVVAFGGSYGGLLSAWFRIKYPHLITAALASSAPVNMFPGLVPCSTYSIAITEAFRRVSELCTHAIRQSWSPLEAMGATEKGTKTLQEKFNLCQTLNPGNYTVFRDWIRDTYAVLALVNYPEPGSLITPLPGSPVKAVCNALTKAIGNRSAMVDAVAAAVNLFFNSTGTRKCHDVSIFQSAVPSWRFQGCTELVMPVCSDGVTDMFYPSSWNLTEVTAKCRETFGVTPDIYKSVMLYGGGHLARATNIVFSNGDVDPWASVGLLEPPSDSVVVIIIPDAAHHQDLRFSTPLDSEALTAARRVEKNYIRKWIDESLPVPEKTPRVVAKKRASSVLFKFSF
ncbi:lysosomal Pro-X carboxypeptidase isoform X2 [Ixodes scapularis]|uniref:lysosomal Pro-X carboxypeptidase isoform X2 n=1 Tax=Ixodes scapularis TaxID=6945 RepID=UPI001A9D42F5|nr:lysosomal Pro-X carboxypeptidase isoform X2 [Ixodes scapularis]